jgi:hypothetical protein
MQALKVQNQIRQNAEEISGFFSDLVKWEKDIKIKDKKIQEKRGAAPIRGSGTVKIQSTSSSLSPSHASPQPSPSSSTIAKSHSAAQHTYDIGYEKWNQIDEKVLSENIENPINLTPAHLLPPVAEVPKVTIPRPRGVALQQDIEQYERERGNSEFNLGNFTTAIKCYTKCLGLKVSHSCLPSLILLVARLKTTSPFQTER